mmetsp:Transcript_836/g.1776  ORF Transcript_836/g.1776 Transcript_836/m.1776 type:complete len:102 (+) Transcript_836:794-1099(+)
MKSRTEGADCRTAMFWGVVKAFDDALRRASARKAKVTNLIMVIMLTTLMRMDKLKLFEMTTNYDRYDGLQFTTDALTRMFGNVVCNKHEVSTTQMIDSGSR